MPTNVAGAKAWQSARAAQERAADGSKTNNHHQDGAAARRQRPKPTGQRPDGRFSQLVEIELRRLFPAAVLAASVRAFRGRHFRRNLRFDARNCDQGGGRSSGRDAFRIPEIANHFEDFAASGKHSAAGTLVCLQCLHELDFVVGVFALASGRIDLAASIYLDSPFQFPSFDSDGASFIRRSSARRSVDFSARRSVTTLPADLTFLTTVSALSR